jgi:hypothetical protein
MTLATLQADLYRRVGLATAPATSETTRLTAFLNETHREILSTPGLESLIDDTVTFASVSAQSLYALPPSVDGIEAITDRTSMVPIPPRSLAWLRSEDPGLTASGTPTVYIPRGLQAVAVQPTAAAEIFIKSTAAGDTGTAFIEGFRTGGYPITTSKVMTGVTAVSFSATLTDVIEITKVYLSAAAVGTVTLHSVSGVGTELARIAIGQTYTRYQGIQLWPTPSAAITYHVDYQRPITDLVNAFDEPLLPEKFHRLLALGARAKEWDSRNDDRAIAAQRDFDRGLATLVFTVTRAAVGTPNLRGSRRAGLSTLGSWYPSGS